MWKENELYLYGTYDLIYFQIIIYIYFILFSFVVRTILIIQAIIF